MLAAALAACGPEDLGTTPTGQEPHPATASPDAARPDAARPAAAATSDAGRTSDDAAAPDDAATFDASAPDERAADAALGPTDGSALEGWSAQPQGPAAQPRVACEHSWAATPFYDLRTSHADPLLLTSDADDNLFVAGYLDKEVDFGTGVLRPPLTQLEKTPRRSTFLLKIDRACNLVWAKALDPASDKTGRWPLALGLDGEGNVALVTNSMRYTYASRFIFITENQFDFLVLGPDGAVRTEKSHPSSSGATAQVSKHGQVMLTTPLGSDGTWTLGDVTVRGAFKQWSNASFRADGTFLRSETFAIAPDQSTINQTLGPHGEVVTDVGGGADYYGQATSDVSLIKLAPDGHLQWAEPVQRATPDDAFYRMLAVAEDGALDVFQSKSQEPTYDVPTIKSFQERAPDGTLRWEVPVTAARPDAFALSSLTSSNASLAALIVLYANTTIGNVELTSAESADDRYLVVQIARGGAVRWAARIGATEEVRAITTTPSDEVAVMGIAGPNGALDAQKIFVRKYTH
ncbi:MAG TPA: hypothetical protein VI299_23570 [Polyangiales bacterium]